MIQFYLAHLRQGLEYALLYLQFYFGEGCKNTNIRLTFDYKTNNKWENSDTFDLYVNGSFKASYAKTNTNWVNNKSVIVQTDSNGWINIQFYTMSNNSNERARIDDVKAEQE